MRPAVFSFVLSLAVVGCAAVPPAPAPVTEPVLQLPPAALGRSLSLVQHLEIEARGQRRSLDALLEADPRSVRLALMQFGQPVARLEWDGRELREQRSPGVPAELSARRTLSELQLVQWPVAAIRAALPAGWFLDEAGEGPGRVRELREGATGVIRIRYLSDTLVELEHLRDRYVLRVESLPAEGT